jgi:hypothetical protein
MKYICLILGAAASALALPARNSTQTTGNLTKPAQTSTRAVANAQVSKLGPVSLVTVTVTASPSSLAASSGSCNGPAPKDPYSSPIVQPNQKAGSASTSSGYWSGSSSTVSHSGPVITLLPVVHWNIDTSNPNNVIPIQVGTGSPQYYAQGGNGSKCISSNIGAIVLTQN